MAVELLPSNKFIIREAVQDDFDKILENEQACYDVPWSLTSLKACFNKDYSFLVLEHQEINIGHMIVQWVLDEAHLHNVCIIPQFQSKGLGKDWLTHLIGMATQRSCRVIFLEVRQSNFKAIQLYTKLGFCQIGERRNYYQTLQGKEHGLVMELRPLSGGINSTSFD